MIDLLVPKTNYDLFLENLIDKNEAPTPPDVILEVLSIDKQNQHRWTRIFTSGNISVIQGKAKAGKTFLLSMGTPAVISGSQVGSFRSIPISSEKRAVIYFDTEQGNYDAYINFNRMIKNCFYTDNFAYCKLRKFTPSERFAIVKETLDHYKEHLQIVFIDGIIDLVNSYNDEKEASDILSFLLKYTEIYNCHISVVIHENKGKDNKEATGWLGRYLYQKAETVISIEATADKFVKKVSSVMQRGTHAFDTFKFKIDVYGNAYVVDNDDTDMPIEKDLFENF